MEGIQSGHIAGIVSFSHHNADGVGQEVGGRKANLDPS